MKVSDWIMVAAMILGPILAIRVQKFLEYFQEKKNRKLQIFWTLMATRGTPLSWEHVRALNMIDIAFYGGNESDKQVLSAWEFYLNKLGGAPKVEEQEYQTKFIVWDKAINDAFVDLLFAMSKTLNYNFNKTHLEKRIYIPEGHTRLEAEEKLMRQGLVELLWGRRTLSVSLQSQPSSVTAEAQKVIN